MELFYLLMNDHLYILRHHCLTASSTHPSKCTSVLCILFTLTRTAYYLGFFDFLQAGKFTTSQPFDPNIYLAVTNMQADTLVNPTCFKIHIKCLKTDPFPMRATSMWAEAVAVFTQWQPLVPSWPCVALPQSHCSAMMMPFSLAALVFISALYLTLGRLSWLVFWGQLSHQRSHNSCFQKSP